MGAWGRWGVALMVTGIATAGTAVGILHWWPRDSREFWAALIAGAVAAAGIGIGAWWVSETKTKDTSDGASGQQADQSLKQTVQGSGFNIFTRWGSQNFKGATLNFSTPPTPVKAADVPAADGSRVVPPKD